MNIENFVHSSSSLHLLKKKRDPFYKTDLGKIILTLVSACPKLRPYLGVLRQYLTQMDLSIKAEGIGAVKRYKAYKAQFLEVVTSGELPPRKFKHARPLFKIALAVRHDSFALSCIHTVFRSYDLYYPPKSLQDKELRSFRESFMTTDPTAIDDSRVVKLQDEVFDFRGEVTDLVSSPEFVVFKTRIRFDSPFRPEEHAILLTKKGTSKFRSDIPSRVQGYAPAIVGSTAELIKAINSQYSAGVSYYDLLSQLGNLIGNYSFPSMKIKDQDPPEGYLEAELRRHCVIPSPGFKSRIIAVGDYNTQYMLSPVHRWAFDVLRQIPSDYTFSHEDGFRKMNEFTRTSNYLACFDLSNATDALPAVLTEEILSQVMPGGRRVASLWRHVMVDIPFQGFYYRIGQPMGLLSSWAAGLALTHHFIVWIAARKCGQETLSRVLNHPDQYYGIVGDDIWIRHPALAHYYSIIMAALGVKINFAKSLIVINDRRVSEFVKRNSFNGNEISAISPGLVVKGFTDYPCSREVIFRLRSLSSGSTMPSSYDEAALVETYECFARRFISAAIGTFSKIPAIYAGLSFSRGEGIWPPQVRFKLLTLKVRELLESHLRATFIGSNGQDTYNDLVGWLLQDITLEGTFHRTQFYEFMKKQEATADSLVNGKSIMRNRLVSLVSRLSYNLSQGYMTDSEFTLYEDEILSVLEEYTPEQTLSVKAVQRALTRSTAYRVYKTLRWYSSESDALAELEQQIFNLSQKYAFKLPVIASNHSPFGEIED